MKILKLEPGAFNKELLPIIGKDKIGWYHEDHEKLVDALFPHLRDEERNAPVLTVQQRDIIKLILCPTEALQRRVLKNTLGAADYELDASTDSVFAMLLSVVKFGDHLSRKENPKTKKPFIVKPKKGQGKKTLDALLAEEPVVEETPAPATSPESQAPVAAAAKKATAKPPKQEEAEE